MGTTLQHPGLPQDIKLTDSVTPAHQGSYRMAGSTKPSQMHRPGQKPLSSCAACNDLNGLVLPDPDFRLCFSAFLRMRFDSRRGYGGFSFANSRQLCQSVSPGKRRPLLPSGSLDAKKPGSRVATGWVDAQQAANPSPTQPLPHYGPLCR